MKKTVLAGSILGISSLIVLGYYSLKSLNQVQVVTERVEAPKEARVVASTRLAHDLPVKVKNPVEEDIFESNLVAVRNSLSDLEDDTDDNRAVESFRKSGLDTQKNYERAVAVLAQPYPQGFGRVDVERRVVALHFLGASSQLSKQDCMNLLETEARLYEEADARGRKALLWDVYGVAKLCAELDAEQVEFLAGKASLKELRAQIRLAVVKYKERHKMN